MEHYFLRDIRALRAMAKPAAKLKQGDTETAIELLQTLLAAEIVCVLRYTSLSVVPISLKYASIGNEFQEQANDERRHMALLAERIIELGGAPNFDPAGLKSKAGAAYAPEPDVAEIVSNNLIAERAVIKLYRHLIRYFSTYDHKTSRILKYILQDEENHIVDMHDLVVMNVSASTTSLH